jgi:hypothetical protein
LTALLSFTVLLLTHQWLTSARTRYAVSAVLLGSLAVYVHPTALVAVFSPLLIALSMTLGPRLGPAASAAERIVVTKRSLVAVVIASVVLALPLLSSIVLGGSTVRWAKGTPTVEGVLTALTIVSGTASVPGNLLFFGLCALGHYVLWKTKPLLGALFVGATGAYVVTLLATRPEGINAGLIVVRYMIVVVPIALTGVALGVERLTAAIATRTRTNPSVACLAGGVVLAGGFFLAGPLPDAQRAPNNFMGHSAYQGSYQRPRWDQSDAHHPYSAVWRRADQIPSFYHWLRDQPDVAAIVEYPFDVCDFNDLYYYYQHFHGKRVVIGYCGDPRRIGVPVVGPGEPEVDPILRMLAADEILSRLPADGRIAFRNMVDVTNRQALLASGAEILVVHKIAPIVSTTAEGKPKTVAVHFTSIDDLDVEFRRIFGPPVYEDVELVCYRVKPSTRSR